VGANRLSALVCPDLPQEPADSNSRRGRTRLDGSEEPKTPKIKGPPPITCPIDADELAAGSQGTEERARRNSAKTAPRAEVRVPQVANLDLGFGQDGSGKPL
jgi:hypothetical protein